MRRNQWEGQDYMYQDQDQDLDQDTTTMASGQYSNHILVNRKIEDKIGRPPLPHEIIWSDADWRKKLNRGMMITNTGNHWKAQDLPEDGFPGCGKGKYCCKMCHKIFEKY